MTKFKMALLGLSFVFAGSTGAMAHDTGCAAGACFTPVHPYIKGTYGSLTCKNPYKRLTYVGTRLTCVPRAGHK